MWNRMAQQPRVRVGFVGQHGERAFPSTIRPSICRDAGAGVEPDLPVALAQLKAVDWLAIEAVAEQAVVHAGGRRDFGDQVVMTPHRIGREIGELCRPPQLLCRMVSVPPSSAGS